MKGIKNSVPAMRHYVASLLLLLLGSVSVTAQIEATGKGVPVQISLNPDKKTIMVGEPLFISFDVLNQSGEKLCLNTGGDYRNEWGRPDRFKVSVRTAEGEELPKIPVSNHGGFIGCDAIEPGETYSVRLFLPHWVKIERPGSYQVNVARQMTFSSFPPPESLEAKYSMLAEVNTEFTVVPADENKIGGVINAFGSVMLDAGDSRAMESATALVSMKDKRVISYFAEALRRFGNSGFTSGPGYEYTISSRSIKALATYDDDQAIDALRAAMKSPAEEIRSLVALAFLHSPHRSAASLLMKMQNDSHSSVRLTVAQGLRYVKTKESIATLQKLLKDENPDVRAAAQDSLSSN